MTKKRKTAYTSIGIREETKPLILELVKARNIKVYELIHQLVSDAHRQHTDLVDGQERYLELEAKTDYDLDLSYNSRKPRINVTLSDFFPKLPSGVRFPTDLADPHDSDDPDDPTYYTRQRFTEPTVAKDGDLVVYKYQAISRIWHQMVKTCYGDIGQNYTGFQAYIQAFGIGIHPGWQDFQDFLVYAENSRVGAEYIQHNQLPYDDFSPYSCSWSSVNEIRKAIRKARYFHPNRTYPEYLFLDYKITIDQLIQFYDEGELNNYLPALLNYVGYAMLRQYCQKWLDSPDRDNDLILLWLKSASRWVEYYLGFKKTRPKRHLGYAAIMQKVSDQEYELVYPPDNLITGQGVRYTNNKQMISSTDINKYMYLTCNKILYRIGAAANITISTPPELVLRRKELKNNG